MGLVGSNESRQMKTYGFPSMSGFSYLTNTHGLTADTTLSYQIVITNGTILEVDQSNYSDLFWGLKGGLNNFVSWPFDFLWRDFADQMGVLGRRDENNAQGFPSRPSLGARCLFLQPRAGANV